jgi:hypothetical protein
MYASQYMLIPLLRILTYTKYMLVETHITLLIFSLLVVLPSLGNASKGSSSWTHTYIQNTIRNNNIIIPTSILLHNIQRCKFTSHIINILNSWILLKSLGEDHLPAVEALLVLPCCCYCTIPVVPPAITGSYHKLSLFKDMFYNNHINN